jgi:RNA polymerase sigma-70 factor, ECF subfamily
MNSNPRRLRRPEERVGQLSNAALPPPADTANTTLLHNLRSRDERTFHELYKYYYSSMLRIATGFVRSRDEAEEVIQETWLSVLSGIDRFQGKSSFRTWLFRILINRRQDTRQA